ncbi:MAG: hypothetical protein AVO34_03715 [Firmicutes bacterium ML8_F2]|jgi:hypothetical protein|nr:MAG: hypothetical protein AVO34_03715 [Firmicutes bacterium ML8_F2]
MLQLVKTGQGLKHINGRSKAKHCRAARTKARSKELPASQGVERAPSLKPINYRFSFLSAGPIPED